MLKSPHRYSKTEVLDFLKSVHPTNLPSDANLEYCLGSYKRFFTTFSLVKGLKGKCLELGSNPYFISMLLEEFTNLEITYSNYFGKQFGATAQEEISYKSIQTKSASLKDLSFHHFNVERDEFPFKNNSFDVLLFCEIIEHLTQDPLKALAEIKRVLKPGGSLILTTPNVTRLENVIKLLLGRNIYDPYSAYGPLGRHNREYTLKELITLLNGLGFTVEKCFTSDVHKNPVTRLLKPLKWLNPYWGQYIFIKAKNEFDVGIKKPRFLYKSYTDDEME